MLASRFMGTSQVRLMTHAHLSYEHTGGQNLMFFVLEQIIIYHIVKKRATITWLFLSLKFTSFLLEFYKLITLSCNIQLIQKRLSSKKTTFFELALNCNANCIE